MTAQDHQRSDIMSWKRTQLQAKALSDRHVYCNDGRHRTASYSPSQPKLNNNWNQTKTHAKLAHKRSGNQSQHEVHDSELHISQRIFPRCFASMQILHSSPRHLTYSFEHVLFLHPLWRHFILCSPCAVTLHLPCQILRYFDHVLILPLSLEYFILCFAHALILCPIVSCFLA